MSVKVAAPSMMPGGMDAETSMHFGHCEIFTIVEIEDAAITAVSTMENAPHEHGGCMEPVQHLHARGVNVLLAGGMGMRPLMGFQQAGIQVCHVGVQMAVGQAVQAFISGRLTQFDGQNTCRGDHCES